MTERTKQTDGASRVGCVFHDGVCDAHWFGDAFFKRAARGDVRFCL